MNLNVIQKIFPLITNQSLLKYDSEGMWSISLPLDAELITNIIKKNTINCKTIFDGTGGLGGNVISFSKNFNSVIKGTSHGYRPTAPSGNHAAYEAGPASRPRA